MAWDSVWEKIFTTQAWGRYPGEDLIRFVARNYYNVPDRASICFLEVGSGTGANIWFLAREGFSATGLEGSPAAVAIARTRLTNEFADRRGAAQNLAIVEGDMVSLPFKDGEFDALIDSEAVYCNSYVDSCAVYRAMYRVARPGARLFVRTFATGSWGDGTGKSVGHHRWIADVGPLAGKGPSRFTAEEEIQELLGPWILRDTNLITRSLGSERNVIREWILEAEKVFE